MKIHKILFYISLIFFFPLLLKAQEKDTLLKYVENEILFIHSRISKRLPVNIHTDSLTFTDRFAPNTDVLFNKLPGLLSLNNENTAQDIRLTIRGFGSRAPFGIRGIRMSLDGIPLTSPDGTTQTDELSLFFLENVSVANSNTAPVSGNAGGGAVALRSLSFFDGLRGLVRGQTTGAYDGGLSWGISNKKSKHVMSLSHHRFDSARDFASGQNTVLYNKNLFILRKDWSLEAILHGYYSPEGKDPGSLTQQEFENNPLMANNRNVLYDAGEEVKGVNIALKSTKTFTDKHFLKTTIFHKTRDFTGRLGFQNGGYIEFLRNYSGISNVFEWNPSEPYSFVLGQGYDRQQDDRRRFANDSGIKGTKDSDQKERVDNVYAFQQFHLKFRKWYLLQMLRYDVFSFSLTDFFSADGIQSGSRSFQNLLGGLGVFFEPKRYWKTYVNVSTGFETPTLNEFTNNPDNAPGFNPNLSSEKSLQFEWGNELDLVKNLNIKASAYSVLLHDVISGYETPDFPGRTFYRNVNQGRRFGVNFTAELNIKKSSFIRFLYEWSHFTYRDFTSPTGQKTDFFQPLIPEHRLSIFYDYDYKSWFFCSLRGSYLSPLYLNDANSVKSPGQGNISLQMNSGHKINKNLTFGFQLHNLFNLTRYSNFRANAAGNRYFETASPPNLSVFIQYQLNKKKE